MNLPHMPNFPGAQPPQVSLPPLSAEGETLLQRAQPGAASQQTPWKMFRASDGKTRVDRGNTSVIMDPAAQKTVILDHLKKEARTLPLPQAPQGPQMPALPGMPAFTPPGVAAPAAPTNVQDLGKSFLQGHEVEGKRYTLPAVQLPQPPGAPRFPPLSQAPQMPQAQLPGMPQAPAAPAPPAAPGVKAPPPPPLPTTVEVWTSPKLQMPMLTKAAGSFGQQTDVVKNAIPGEPSPALFQIPAGYKSIPMPAAPAAPKVPGIPG
ncbi:MAG: hypothetical protein ACRD9L_00785 [Bryobacteraceae bacterium]